MKFLVPLKKVWNDNYFVYKDEVYYLREVPKTGMCNCVIIGKIEEDHRFTHYEVKEDIELPKTTIVLPIKLIGFATSHNVG